MSERSLILMGGAPGSGTSRLGTSIERQLRSADISAEHISTGNHIRHIGAGIIHSAHTAAVIEHLNSSHPHAPLDDEIVYDIVNEALHRHDNSRVVLLDGYPRYITQVESAEELAIKEARRLAGMLVTTVDMEMSLTRMIKRGQKHPDRVLTIDEAISRLAEYGLTFPQVLKEVRERGIPVAALDTSGSKETADQLGLTAVRYFLTHPS